MNFCSGRAAGEPKHAGIPLIGAISIATACRYGILILILQGAALVPVTAQEALQNMLAGDTAANTRNQQMQSPAGADYTFKKGDFRLMVTPGAGLEYDDNINLANTNVMDDIILTPSVGITASYPLSRRNLLYLDFTVGYNWYMEHPQYSSFSLNSSTGTGLSFDMAIKDVTLDFHDWVSYSQGAGQSASLDNTANGAVANSATYGTFMNTAGISALWDLNQVQLSAGYDHQTVMSTSSQFDNISHSAEMLFARGKFQVHPKISVGLETTVNFTSYDQAMLNDNSAYTIGPYIEFRPSQYLTVTARGGFTTYQFQNTSTVVQTADDNSWYAGLQITHRPTDSISYSLDVGREVQTGIQTDLMEDWYVRPNITWNIIKNLSLSTTLFYEHGNQGVGSTGTVAGGSNGTFDWYGGGIDASRMISKRLSLSLSYRLTFRTSDTPNTDYTLNLVMLQLTYRL
jgi:hypothetical protein